MREAAAPEAGPYRAERVLFLVFLAKPGGEFFVDRLAMADCHDTNRTSPAVDSVNDSKAANAKLPQSVEVAQQRLTAFRIDGNRANR